MTFGQAVDAAIRQHVHTYPDSAVYSATAAESDTKQGTHYRVELRAEHFSQPLIYLVDVRAT